MVIVMRRVTSRAQFTWLFIVPTSTFCGGMTTVRSTVIAPAANMSF